MVIIDFRFFEDYATDHLGSSSVLTTDTGSYYERLEYLPYGEVWVEDAAINSNYRTPYKFTGKELDKETGLYYFGARYYDARISRWISTDPALAEGKYFPKPNDYDTEHDFYWYYKNQDIKKLKGIGGIYRPINLDTYRYCGNNPIIITDPDGKTDNKTYITDPENNNKTIAPISVKGVKVDIVKIAKAQQEHHKKTIEAQKWKQKPDVGSFVVAGSLMVAGAAAIPVVTIGAVEVLSTTTSGILLNSYTFNSIAIGFIQGLVPPSPVIFENSNMLTGFIAGYFTGKVNEIKDLIK